MVDKNKAMTPGDIVFAVVGNDPKAIISAIKKTEKADKKYDTRVIERNDKGVAVVKQAKQKSKTKKIAKKTK